MASGALAAQAADYRVHHRVDETGRLYLRWEPRSWAAFARAVDAGVTLELLGVGGGPGRPRLTPLERTTLRPLTVDEWLPRLGGEWDSIAIAAVHAYALPEALQEETFLTEAREAGPDSTNDFRWQVSNYALGYDWEATVRSGMGWAGPREQKFSRLALKLYSPAGGDTTYAQFDLADYREPEIPPLEANFRDRNVELKWRTADHRAAYFAWHLEKSVDGGPFTDLFGDLPLTNDYDEDPRADEELKYLYHTDVLDDNDQTITYRLRGQNHLGTRSVTYSEISGRGRRDITLSPLLTRTIQTDSNYAVIQWEFDPAEEYLLREFRIIHRDSQRADYQVALDGIAPDVREVSIPMRFRSNFYRVQAVSQLGTEYSSFESLVMAFDDEPPAVPRDFTGYIDSLGAAHFHWTTSDEPDLAGYYLFKGYFTGTELAMVTPDPVPGPSHVDSVDMATGNEAVYYQLRSVDTRGNGSAFTPVLRLKKPDVFPPGAPQIRRARAGGGRVFLSWVPSPAADVASYRLERSRDEGPFIAVLTFDTLTYRSSFTDTTVVAGSVYRYRLFATDDDGLESEPSQLVALKVSTNNLRGRIEDLTVAAPATLRWTFTASPREFYLYRAVGDEPPALLKVLPGDLREWTDPGLRPGERYAYFMQAVFDGGEVSPFSPRVEYTAPPAGGPR